MSVWVRSSFFILALVSMFSAYAQQPQHMVGRVFDEYGNPLKSATVYNKSEKQKVHSSASGSFKIGIQSGDTLMITSNQYVIQEYIVPQVSNSLHFENFMLKLDREQMLLDLQQMREEKNIVITEAVGTIRLAGKITSITDEPLKDVNVIKRHTFQGTVSNDNGIYGMNVNIGDTIEFSFIGHTPQMFVIEPTADNVIMYNVQLISQAVMLDDLKVTPGATMDYGYKKTGMDGTESTNYTLQQHVLRTDKNYFPTVGFSTAKMGGVTATAQKIGKLFGADQRKKKKAEELTERQRIMREKYLKMLNEQKQDSVQTQVD